MVRGIILEENIIKAREILARIKENEMIMFRIRKIDPKTLREFRSKIKAIEEKLKTWESLSDTEHPSEHLKDD